MVFWDFLVISELLQPPQLYVNKISLVLVVNITAYNSEILVTFLNMFNLPCKFNYLAFSQQNYFNLKWEYCEASITLLGCSILFGQSKFKLFYTPA